MGGFVPTVEIGIMVIMNSGSFTGKSQVKNGLQANFEKISKRLTNEYPHIHIIAMVRRENHSAFDLRYLHNGTDKLIEVYSR